MTFLFQVDILMSMTANIRKRRFFTTHTMKIELIFLGIIKFFRYIRSKNDEQSTLLNL
jgi:hypothetical protein